MKPDLEQQLTPWFPADVKPVRKGVYERAFFAREFPSYWNGKQWGVCCFDRDDAYDYRQHRSEHQRLPWRGLARPATRSEA
jgi:hypothetical protein